jgi:hypothetical protein
MAKRPGKDTEGVQPTPEELAENRFNKGLHTSNYDISTIDSLIVDELLTLQQSFSTQEAFQLIAKFTGLAVIALSAQQSPNREAIIKLRKKQHGFLDAANMLTQTRTPNSPSVPSSPRRLGSMGKAKGQR